MKNSASGPNTAVSPIRARQILLGPLRDVARVPVVGLPRDRVRQLQINLSVGTAQNGSMNAVAGSGMASMSLLLMAFQPRMEEPSKPNPSLNTLPSIRSIGIEKCCHVPTDRRISCPPSGPYFFLQTPTLHGESCSTSFQRFSSAMVDGSQDSARTSQCAASVITACYLSDCWCKKPSTACLMAVRIPSRRAGSRTLPSAASVT